MKFQDQIEVERVGVGVLRVWDSGHSGLFPPLLAEAVGSWSEERAGHS